MRALLLTTAGSSIGMGGLIVLEALLIKVVLNAGDAGYGLMLSIARSIPPIRSIWSRYAFACWYSGLKPVWVGMYVG